MSKTQKTDLELYLQPLPNTMFRTAFDGLSDEVSNATGLFCPEPTLAQQQFAEECDINTIVNQFLRGGEMPDNELKPQFGDFTGAISDYHAALNLVIAADEAFFALPASIRTRFHNDAAEYVDFFNDPKNRAEAEKLGLVQTRQESSTNDDSNTSVGDDSSKKKSSSSKGVKSASNDDEGGA
jgi:phage internal scaffolding protein